MKISASIYSDSNRPLKEVIQDLVDHQVDLLHVDCNDDLSVFEDIKSIRKWCDLPIDLHIITEEPKKYFKLLVENPVEYVTFQYEQLSEPLILPKTITGKKGIAVITPTPIDIFEEYTDFDFILIMATIPGQSGGVFDKVNFDKIRRFRRTFPSKSIHVDGGVNGEVSFILRNMGVSSSVSGSYLFKGPSIGNALMNLTNRSIESHFQIADFMMPIEEAPVVLKSNLSVENCLKSIESGKLGFCVISDDDHSFIGIVSNADIRKGLLNNLEDFNALRIEDVINHTPKTITESATVLELIQFVKSCSFPIMYLPVLNNTQKIVGIVNFVNLIKGEL